VTVRFDSVQLAVFVASCGFAGLVLGLFVIRHF
jgi:hypothetical protein